MVGVVLRRGWDREREGRVSERSKEEDAALDEVGAKDALVYEHLLTAIYEAQLPPGTKLPEDALAEAFGVSRAGVRKALQRLSIARLVDLRPNRGASVAEPTVQESRDVFAARRLIECGALPLAMANLRKEDLSVLADALRQECKAQHEQNRSAAITWSGAFHLRLLSIAGNQLLTDILHELIVRSSLIIARYGAPIAGSCRHADHQQILELMENGQADEAVEWMRRHLDAVEGNCRFEEESAGGPDLKAVLHGIAKRRSGR